MASGLEGEPGSETRRPVTNLTERVVKFRCFTYGTYRRLD